MNAMSEIAIPAFRPNPEADEAELILICRQFIKIERCIQGLYDGPERIEDDDMADMAACNLEVTLDALLARMEPLRATTAAGIQARAEALAVHNSDRGFSFDDPEMVAGRLLDYLMRDALALASAAAGSA